jgi:hypothetical protein
MFLYSLKRLRGLSPRANYTGRSLSAKIVSTFAERWCHEVSATDPYGPIPCFLDRSHYFFLQVATHEAEWTPFETQYFLENLVAPGIEPGPLDL